MLMKAENGLEDQLLASDPLSSTIHNNFKECLSLFHIINEPHDIVIGERM